MGNKSTEAVPEVETEDLLNKEHEGGAAPLNESPVAGSGISFVVTDKYKCNKCSDSPRYFKTFPGLCSHLEEIHG